MKAGEAKNRVCGDVTSLRAGLWIADDCNAAADAAVYAAVPGERDWYAISRIRRRVDAAVDVATMTVVDGVRAVGNGGAT